MRRKRAQDVFIRPHSGGWAVYERHYPGQVLIATFSNLREAKVCAARLITGLRALKR